MKKYFIDFPLIGLLFLVFLYWGIQGPSVENFRKYLPLIVAIISIYMALKQFRLRVTIDKIQGFTVSPETSQHVIRVFKFIDMANSGSSEKSININDIEKDETLYASILFLLGFCDDLAGGIKIGIIDEKLARKLQGGFMIRIYKKLKPYIEEVDALRKRPTYPNLMEISSNWDK